MKTLKKVLLIIVAFVPAMYLINIPFSFVHSRIRNDDAQKAFPHFIITSLNWNQDNCKDRLQAAYYLSMPPFDVELPTFSSVQMTTEIQDIELTPIYNPIEIAQSKVYTVKATLKQHINAEGKIINRTLLCEATLRVNWKQKKNPYGYLVSNYSFTEL